MHRFPVNNRSTHGRLTIDRCSLWRRWHGTVYGHRVNDVSINTVNYRISRLAQPRSVLGHRIQHWLNVSGRASDDAQDLAGRRLPLQPLPKVPRLRGDRLL